MQRYQKDTEVIYHLIPVKLSFDVDVDDRSSFDNIQRGILPGVQLKIYRHSDGKKYVSGYCTKELIQSFQEQEAQWIRQNGHPMTILPQGSNVYLGSIYPICTKETYSLMVFFEEHPDKVFENKDNQKGDGHLCVVEQDENSLYEIGLWNEERELIYKDEMHQKNVRDSIFAL